MDKTFNAKEAEPRLYRRWEESGVFEAGSTAGTDAQPYCIMIPPPNVTGVLHMGHAFNNTIQDVLIRWRRMQGRDVLWQPGQDHAGIATQMVVERQLAAGGEPTREALGREKFLDRVWAWKEESGDAIIHQLKRLGASCDWSRNRFTMDAGFHDAVLEAFVRLYRKGIIYRGKRLVNWDPHFATAISDLEVEQVELDGQIWRFRYPLEDGVSYRRAVAFDDDGKATDWADCSYIVVATTRPETMLGDTGVAVHPDDERYTSLIGATVRLPLANRSIPIVADPHADPDKGSGAVKITPAHDFNDWQVGQRTGLPAISIMNQQAEMELRENCDFLRDCNPDDAAMALHGLDRHDARRRVVELAKAGDWFDGVDDERHMVPHGDRSKVPIEPLLTDQWFIDARRLVEPAMAAIHDGRTRIHPARQTRTYLEWLENIEPWCISRQLWWGHRIPVWYDDDGQLYCARNEAEAQRLAGERPLRQESDVLDTWFSSGLWPIGTLGWPEDTEELGRYFPTNVLVTGFDIIFFWVARMMMMQLELVEQVPFTDVYVHALVRDAKGRKMAKSIGNAIDPLDLVDRYGADAVRFTLASMAAMGRDLRLAEDRVEGARNFSTKIWNAARFAMLHDCRVDDDFVPDTLQLPVNRWIVGETGRTLQAVDQALEEFRFNEAANRLQAFARGSLCDRYLEFAKPYLSDDGLESRAETCATAGWVIRHCLIMLHPFMPFITEEIWSLGGFGDGMIAQADWPSSGQDMPRDPVADKEMEWVIALIDEVRSLRALMRVPAGQFLPLHAIELDIAARDALKRNMAQICRLARVSLHDLPDGIASTITHQPQAVPEAGEAHVSYNPASHDAGDRGGTISLTVQGAVFALELGQSIDIEAECDRLSATLASRHKEAEGLECRLLNENFTSRAPDHVIEDTRLRLTALREESEAMHRALERLSAKDRA